MSRLTIFRGLPGSGKTHAARAFADRTGAILLEPDMLCTCDTKYAYTRGAYAVYVDVIQDIIRTLCGIAGCDIVYADVLATSDKVREVIAPAVACGYDIMVVTIASTYDHAMRNNVHAVNESDLARMADLFVADPDVGDIKHYKHVTLRAETGDAA